ncbi:VgrG-related protein [Phormidium sp. FACHB-592]|uniref:VgrG-related protein n=1 Tax=Stenomitos frigidus AS-A4 TaxID=2933935 RepID=A0ABV0KP14_9CYAN|nr:VgrG-related protein [Phormidium sp. FACHB-592]MBD2072905.1 VgrG-related protein [Phormidium sp. FACHB-592]
MPKTTPSTYVAEPELEIEGQPAPIKLMENLLQISIEESLHLPSMFTIVVNNPDFPGLSDQPTLEPRQANKLWDHEALFAIGKSVRIGFRNSTTAASEFQVQEKDWIIVGEITAIETHFTSGSQAPIMIRGYDRSHRLHRGHHNRSFQNMTDTDIVKKIIREVDVPAGSIEDSGAPHDYVFQENQTNLEFLRERAARNGFELFVQNGKLNFHKPKNNQALELAWLEQIASFQVSVSSAKQVDAVEVRGWNYKQKKAIVATRNQDTILTQTDQGKGKTTSSAFQGKPNAPKLIVVDQPIATQQEADKIAQSLFNELSDEFVHADALAQGHPSIRPGRVAKLKGMGKYSGDYYITETHHRLSEGVYTTAFSIRGLRGGDLLSLLAPPIRLQPGQTLLIGQVTNNDDPEGLGRVRVEFPTLTEDHDSAWARVVAIGAGKNRGFDCLPEIDDEVLVGFEHGDIHRPFVIGGLWNGSDEPPESVSNSVMGSKVRLRTIKTRTGHQIQFVEEPSGGSQAGITIKTVGGHLVQMNDTDRSITLSSTGNLKITAVGNIDISATGIITVQGAMIKLN